MEFRRSERKIVSLNAVLISEDRNYAGVIGNLSEDGVYIRTDPTKTAIDFLPDTSLELKFHISSKETINLHCEVIWLYTKRNPPIGLENDIGMEIKNSSQEYEKFITNL